MKILILGTGCRKCGELYDLVVRVAGEPGFNLTVHKVEDMQEILTFNVLQLPALVIDGQVVIYGRIPSGKEIKEVILKHKTIQS